MGMDWQKIGITVAVIDPMSSKEYHRYVMLGGLAFKPFEALLDAFFSSPEGARPVTHSVTLRMAKWAGAVSRSS
jgi:hypothetical protein